MLTGFFLHLKANKLPVSTRELLTLLEALEKRVVSNSIDDFYMLSRACFVKVRPGMLVRRPPRSSLRQSGRNFRLRGRRPDGHR